jgi:alpha-tubulin suppressor-like RCC1 family protein
MHSCRVFSRFPRVFGAFLLLLVSGCGSESPAPPGPPDPVGELADELLLISTKLAPEPIAVGGFFGCALLDGGLVKCWGANGGGQLGLGDAAKRGDGPGEMGNALPNVRLGRTAKAISAGYTHACALLDTNQIKCWGTNSHGELGLGDTNARGDAVHEMGDNLPAVNLGTNRSAKAVTAGVNFSCALLDTNQVKCWGRNSSGQLGLGDTDTRGDAPSELGDYLPIVNLGVGRSAKKIAAGAFHVCAVLDNDKLKCWGENQLGELGLGNTQDRGDNPSEMGDGLPHVDLDPVNPVLAVSSGGRHTCALLGGVNRIKCWGSNSDGQLGLGDKNRRGDGPNEMGANLPFVDLGPGRTVRAVAAGDFYTCALLGVNQVKCWGNNLHGELGLGDAADRGDGPGEMGDALPLVSVGTNRSVVAVAVSRESTAGAGHTCVALNDGRAKCWGYSADGELGLGDTAQRGDGAAEMGDLLPAIDLGSRGNLSVAVGYFHTCTLMKDQRVKCWGDNSAGQLGLGDTNHRGAAPNQMGANLPAVDLGTGRTAKALALGFTHSCALLDTNLPKCWGENEHGQAGTGTGEGIFEPTHRIGDAPGEMGNNLVPVNLGSGRTAKAIASGYMHTCAILDTNQVKCWGANGSGQLGIGDRGDRGYSPSTIGDLLPAVDLGTGRTAKAIDAGAVHTCAILDNNQLKCWGENGLGELGIEEVPGEGDFGRGDQPGEMGDNLPAVKLGTGRTAKAIALGAHHTCAILDNNQIKCWGSNFGAALGLGDTVDRGSFPGEMGDNLPFVSLGTGHTAIAISAGEDGTCALLATNQVKCWGSNGNGQLGQSHSIDPIGALSNQMGDYLSVVQLGTERSARSVSIEGPSACAVLNDGHVKCWGHGGKLGLGDGLSHGFSPADMGDNLPVVDLGPES